MFNWLVSKWLTKAINKAILENQAKLWQVSSYCYISVKKIKGTSCYKIIKVW